MAFTASDVKALRERTGVGMMDCKKALTEAEGDFERAIDILRERGLAAATKKAGRITAEGVVLAYQEGDVSVLVEVNSETDFVGKNEDFRAFVLDVAKTVATENPADVDALLQLRPEGNARTIEELRQEKVLSIGENISVRRFARVAGNPAVCSYIHGGGAIGVLAEFSASEAAAQTEAFQTMGKYVAMQIASMRPQYLSEKAVPAEVSEHEAAIVRAQMAEDPKMQGKPEKVIEGIMQGKLKKIYSEICLLEQDFVFLDDVKQTVGQYIAATAKALGEEIACTGYVLFVKGENIQKREDDFAAEVAKLGGSNQD
ncbi:MAG: translation elongation factor Ts [Oscillospiraceae bacterium]|jgi:elongation factor Ts|nr:translation elongation factor Ts [Oscillospiraceae bacterium]